MIAEPDAADLLRIARRTLLDAVLPCVPGHLRYASLMIANAMAIAEREIALDAPAAQRELEQLRALLGEEPPLPAEPLSREKIEGARRQLATAIRAGCFDGARRAELLDHLRQTAADKLAISNPKALDT